MTKVYIAAPFEEQANARVIASLLATKGFHVTSTWLHEAPSNVTEKVGASNSLERATEDLFDILQSDAVFLINPESYRRSGSGGRHVEFGVAIMAQLPIWIFGVRSNVFHYHECVKNVSEDLVALVGHMRFNFGIDS